MKTPWFPLAIALCACSSARAQAEAPAPQGPSPAFGQGIMVGELTPTSAVVQARVTLGTELVDGEIYDDGDALRHSCPPLSLF